RRVSTWLRKVSPTSRFLPEMRKLMGGFLNPFRLRSVLSFALFAPVKAPAMAPRSWSREKPRESDVPPAGRWLGGASIEDGGASQPAARPAETTHSTVAPRLIRSAGRYPSPASGAHAYGAPSSLASLRAAGQFAGILV